MGVVRKILLSLVILAIGYGASAFGMWQLNPAFWSVEARAVTVSLSLVAILFLWVVSAVSSNHRPPY